MPVPIVAPVVEVEKDDTEPMYGGNVVAVVVNGEFSKGFAVCVR